MFGVGNYDVNVLMAVLQRHGLQVKWHDARQEVTLELLENYRDLKNKDSANEVSSSNDNNSANDTNIFGIVVNIPSNSLWARYVTKGRHWLTLLWMDDKQQWVNLDSDLTEPLAIGNMAACVQQLQEWKQRYEACHILLVSS
jgi:hypothetical protein